MARALNATGRPIVYSCSWPAYQGGLPPKVGIFHLLASSHVPCALEKLLLEHQEQGITPHLIFHPWMVLQVPEGIWPSCQAPGDTWGSQYG